MSAVTIEEINALSEKYLAKYADYEEAKKLSTQLYKEAGDLEGQLLDLLSASGQSKVYLEGKGTVYQIYRTSISIEDKVKLFNHIKEKYGPEVLLGMQTIGSPTLNKFFKEEMANGVTQLPGTTAPVASVSLGFRKG